MTRFPLGPLWWFVAVGSALGLVVIAIGEVRAGGYLLAVVLGLTGIFRISLPDKAVGALAIRSRAGDGAALIILAIVVAILFSILKLTPLPA
ncbi:DUF3017 domain-containing protein [Flexivirga caeni]|uniref:DUF3017 domain-containing protein n=1 Tax=Flexivirga caeni TaxID=2294115 RepID=A0A3M9M9F3_9MICO|nr:DUF3017 domain-containing protein [Flexivirga caeni]RNI22189.1 DUF3017 domain-containing protein [Flexivirga caeni]